MDEESKKIFVCIYCHKEHPLEVDTCPETDNPLTPVHKLADSILEEKYRIRKFIGEGGMGVIYESEHIAIGKKLAVKFLNPELRKTKEAYERFKREAKASAIIAHKNIVDVIDIGETNDGIPYIIMEYLSGEDLGHRITSWGRIPLLEAREVLAQVLEALAAVHSCGVVHRDLKPENIFLARQSGGSEIVKVLDFGISRLTRSEDAQASRLTKAGYVYGTPNYIAPEQAEGRANIDHRADLYSAGMIFYEMVTGQLPYSSESYAALLVDIITKPLPNPRNFYPELSQSVVNFINLSLDKDPNERFQSAQEMLRELKSIDIDAASLSSLPPSADSRSSLSQSARKRTTPVKELSVSTHKDYSTPKNRRRTSSSSSYKIVTSGRKSTSPGSLKSTPPPEQQPAPKEEEKKEAPKVSKAPAAAPPPSRSSSTPGSDHAGSYRIARPASENINEPVKKNEKMRDEASSIAAEDTMPKPPMPPAEKIKGQGAEARKAIERARTLPTPLRVTVKKKLKDHQEVTPTPDSGGEEESS